MEKRSEIFNRPERRIEKERPEVEQKKESSMEERLVERWKAGEVNDRFYFFDVYTMMPEEKREKVKECIKKDKEIPDKFKEEFLDRLKEKTDKDAEKWYQTVKKWAKEISPHARKDWLRKREQALEFYKDNLKEIEREESEKGIVGGRPLPFFLGLDEAEVRRKELVGELKQQQEADIRLSDLPPEEWKKKGLTYEELRQRIIKRGDKIDYYSGKLTKEDMKDMIMGLEVELNATKKAIEEVEVEVEEGKEEK